MAIIRVTQELLEYALDLPEGVELVGSEGAVEVDGVRCFVFRTSGEADNFPDEGDFALQYDTGEFGEPELLAAIPVT